MVTLTLPESPKVVLVQTLAHVSDLHLGASDEYETVAHELVRQLIQDDVDHVVVTGDICEQGSPREMRSFERAFAPLLDAEKVTIVPGNHDRVGQDAGQHMMQTRVQVAAPPGLWLVQVDSTAPHNRSYFASHGHLAEEDIEEIAAALDAAPAGRVTAILMHHHPLPLPLECIQEHISDFLGWPHASELPLGQELVERALGRCDLLLHGHRHIPRQTEFASASGRRLIVANAGSTTERCSYPVYRFSEGQVRLPMERTLDHPVPRAPSAWRALLTAVSSSGPQFT